MITQEEIEKMVEQDKYLPLDNSYFKKHYTKAQLLKYREEVLRDLESRKLKENQTCSKELN